MYDSQSGVTLDYIHSAGTVNSNSYTYMHIVQLVISVPSFPPTIFSTNVVISEANYSTEGQDADEEARPEHTVEERMKVAKYGSTSGVHAA